MVIHLNSLATVVTCSPAQNACDALFVKYDAKENIDIMHAVVTEARARRQAGEPPGPDTWRADLDPRSAARARTIPVLKNERDELKARLAEVRARSHAVISK